MEFNLGATIKKLRTSRQITQEELAHEMNVTYQAVSKWENNTTTPDISLLPRLAIYFGISMDTLFSLDKEAHLQRIGNMIRDEYTIPADQFAWAEEYLCSMLEEEPHDQNARVLLVELFGHRINRDQLSAIRLCKQGLLQDPDQKALHQKLMRLGNQRKDAEMLYAFYFDLYQKFSDCDFVAEQLATVYASQNEHNQALQIISKHPTINNRLLEGEILFSMGKQSQAIGIWEQTASEHPSDCAVLYSVAECMERHGQEEQAKRYYLSSYSQSCSPKSLDALYALSFMYTRQKRYRDAIDMWNQIILDLKQEHSITKGECIDWAKREIAKLNALCANG